MTSKAYFAAGCFWGVQKAFDEMKGVTETTVGYMGGHAANPTYEEVSAGKTGHAESIEVVFDPDKVYYKNLVNRFLEIHDPTQLNRQPARPDDAGHSGGGPDVGHQYRSVVFYTTNEQKVVAEEIISELRESGKYDRPIVTEIIPAQDFWPAESYHQKYYIAHPGVC